MEADKKDIFDRIMLLPGLRLFYSGYARYKTVLLYIFFGGCTTFISIGTFVLFSAYFRINELIANVISWICAVAFAYVTNRIWVFTSKSSGKAVGREVVSFFTGRLFTLGMEELLIYVFVTLLSVNGVVVKILGQILVLILNYLLSKLWVFQQKEH